MLSVIKPSTLDENYDVLLNRIHWDKIFIKQQLNGLTTKDLMVKTPRKGRVTLHGENGSGKTSLLLMIKTKHKDTAFYLPSKT